MKNKKEVSKILLVFLVLLVVVAGLYIYINRDKVFSSGVQDSNNEKGNEPSISNADDSSRGEQESDEDNDDVPPVPTPDLDSDNQSDFIEYGLKKVETYAEFNTLISRPNKNMFVVFGRQGCYFCEKYIPILNEVSQEYKVEIIYIDLLSLDASDYENVINTPLIIPGECTKDGIDSKLSAGFGTPLSLFINNNETYSCIRGYKDKKSLQAILKDNNYIK